MDTVVSNSMHNIHSTDRELQNQAYLALMAATESPVDWAYEAWDGLVADLRHSENRVRSIASQVLCSLAKSDPEKRILKDFESLLTVTRDERFVTARHCLQSLWKIGLAGSEQRTLLLLGLEQRFNECSVEKNCTLIRYDILEALKKLYDALKEDEIRQKALAWIETEPDLKYRKKYAGLWRGQ